jgi:DNA polymerase
MAYISPDFRISKEHGQWHEIDGTRRMALYHPAALLRDPRRRPETFVDLKELQRVILEICEHTPLDMTP